MSLMFTRIARNHIKAGYFPTDEITLSRILNAISATPQSKVRIVDPCCGEGAALAEIKHHLQTKFKCQVESLGVEYDAERAKSADTLLDRALHTDVNDAFITPKSCSLLFLNPPYGESVKDHAQTSSTAFKQDRMELFFLKKTMSWLQPGGLMVFIIPHYALTKDMSSLIARSFSSVSVFTAPEHGFKQVVIFGVRKPLAFFESAIEKQLLSIAQGQYADTALCPELPESWDALPYCVPSSVDNEKFRFVSIRIEPERLAKELALEHKHTLWPQFASHFQGQSLSLRRPLRKMSKWHLALALAAGQITGLIEAGTQRLLIKGSTLKEKVRSTEEEFMPNGDTRVTVIMTDKFSPSIYAIDFSSGPTYGDVVLIK